MDKNTYIQTMFWKLDTHIYTKIAKKYTHLGDTSLAPKI